MTSNSFYIIQRRSKDDHILVKFTGPNVDMEYTCMSLIEYYGTLHSIKELLWTESRILRSDLNERIGSLVDVNRISKLDGSHAVKINLIN